MVTVFIRIVNKERILEKRKNVAQIEAYLN